MQIVVDLSTKILKTVVLKVGSGGLLGVHEASQEICDFILFI